MTPEPNIHLTYEFDTDPDYNTPRLRAVFVDRMNVLGYENQLRPTPRHPKVDDGRCVIDTRLMILRTVSTKNGLEKRWCSATNRNYDRARETRYFLAEEYIKHIRSLGWDTRPHVYGGKNHWVKPGTAPNDQIREQINAAFDADLE